MRIQRPGDVRTEGRRQPLKPRQPSARTQLRVEWLRALVDKFGPGRVGGCGCGRPFHPPVGWTFEEWRVRRRSGEARRSG